METKSIFTRQNLTIPLLLILVYLSLTTLLQAQVHNYNQFKGVIQDSNTGKPLTFATITVSGTNISTISNTAGEFLLKVPDSIVNAKVTISFIGYRKQSILLTAFKKVKNRIKLVPSIIKLPDVSVLMPSDARSLVLQTLKKKGDNNLNQPSIMTAFYRETIKKRKKNVSLAEAIVNIYKQPYNSTKKDIAKLYKARKSTDYSKLDTLALKLQGGPYNALYIDLLKYPEYMFSDDVIDFYNFSFAPSTTINEKPVYVINFKQRKEVTEPLYYGKLFIDYETLALTSAVYNLNVENKELTSKLFVKRKPRDVFVYPTRASYRVDYNEKNGKWYYSYSNVQLTFKIKRKRKLFNSVYSLSSEMAVTNWKKNTTKERVKFKDRIRPSVIIADEASGFSDPNFWGAYNIIEPEKSIESAINKIKRQLKKIEKS